MTNGNSDNANLRMRPCPMPTGLAVDPKTGQPHIIGTGDFCPNCKMFNTLANKCEFLIQFEKVRKMEGVLDAIMSKIDKTLKV